MNLWEIPRKAWHAIERPLDPGADSSRAEAAVFPADRELWRFVVSSNLNTTWVERLHRMFDSSLSQEVHTARSRTLFRRSVLRFRGSTYQPDMRGDGQLFVHIRSSLAKLYYATMNCLCSECYLSNGAQECCTSYFRQSITRKSKVGRNRICRCPTPHSDARRMCHVGIKHGIWICRYH